MNSKIPWLHQCPLSNHQLQTVAAACGYNITNHHHSLGDAEACVMKYISPQYWENMDILIRELELEIVGVTKSRMEIMEKVPMKGLT